MTSSTGADTAHEGLSMTSAPAPTLRKHGNAYNIFILVLTIFSLAIMVLLLLPISAAERDLLTLYDNVVCLIFLGDFAINLLGSKPQGAYFIGQRGWLDLLGSIPSFGFIPFGALRRSFRLARSSAGSPGTRLLRGQAGKDLVLDVLRNRGQYAAFITVLLAGMTLAIASILVLQFESTSPDGNITTGGAAIWWGIVDDHDGRLRGLLPGDDARPPDRDLRHVRRHRHHRGAREHPREPARLADVGRRGAT